MWPALDQTMRRPSGRNRAKTEASRTCRVAEKSDASTSLTRPKTSPADRIVAGFRTGERPWRSPCRAPLRRRGPRRRQSRCRDRRRPWRRSHVTPSRPPRETTRHVEPGEQRIVAGQEARWICRAISVVAPRVPRASLVGQTLVADERGGERGDRGQQFDFAGQVRRAHRAGHETSAPRNSQGPSGARRRRTPRRSRTPRAPAGARGDRRAGRQSEGSPCRVFASCSGVRTASRP